MCPQKWGKITILDKADAIRRKRQQAIQLADEFLRAVFLDMFGDPVTNPKGWEVRKVSDISRQVTVGLVIKPASYYVDKGIPAIRSLNIKETGIDQNNFVYFSESDNAGPLAKSRVYSGDIVIVRSGQPGKAAVIPDDLDGVNAIDVLILRPDAQCINSDYFAYFMNSGAGKNLVMSEGRGQIQQHLNVGSLSAADMPVPALELQEKFVRTLKDIRDKFSVEGDGKHSGLFNSLSQKAFKGEL
ncbi:restriction endonuclease subunit S [Parathalassolituus penaei]|uniref:Restriction endonuclease subunit S n=1 Tax=Parathalassolituus penaei TaxID=2997323 RepID=A0A9X3ISE4_9GAMM|nr:restriction endonuclease subunit S [Parathalassolituus penaei]MCY0965180.1 restriction endonuclease subunit S [Parathalassolituus penaei]